MYLDEMMEQGMMDDDSEEEEIGGLPPKLAVCRGVVLSVPD